jgi:hypothetical protein
MRGELSSGELACGESSVRDRGGGGLAGGGEGKERVSSLKIFRALICIFFER